MMEVAVAEDTVLVLDIIYGNWYLVRNTVLFTDFHLETGF